MDTSEPTYPELAKLRAFDRQEHVTRALAMGMTRDEAERHADDDMKHRDDAKE